MKTSFLDMIFLRKLTKKALAFLVINFVCFNCYAQEKGDLFKANSDMSNILHSFDMSSNNCNNSVLFSAQTNTVFEVIKKLAGGEVVVKVVRAYVARTGISNEVHRNTLYCINSSNLNDYSVKIKQIDHGFLAVPFKLRPAPINIFLGGTLGYYAGRKFEGRSSSHTILGFAGASTISLNDVNRDVPETKLGVTGGLGYVWKLRDGFQIGAVTGVDLFDGVSKWSYGYQPWVAFAIGFNFTSDNAQNSGGAQQTLQH